MSWLNIGGLGLPSGELLSRVTSGVTALASDVTSSVASFNAAAGNGREKDDEGENGDHVTPTSAHSSATAHSTSARARSNSAGPRASFGEGDGVDVEDDDPEGSQGFFVGSGTTTSRVRHAGSISGGAGAGAGKRGSRGSRATRAETDDAEFFDGVPHTSFSASPRSAHSAPTSPILSSYATGSARVSPSSTSPTSTSASILPPTSSPPITEPASSSDLTLLRSDHAPALALQDEARSRMESELVEARERERAATARAEQVASQLSVVTKRESEQAERTRILESQLASSLDTLQHLHTTISQLQSDLAASQSREESSASIALQAKAELAALQDRLNSSSSTRPQSGTPTPEPRSHARNPTAPNSPPLGSLTLPGPAVSLPGSPMLSALHLHLSTASSHDTATQQLQRTVQAYHDRLAKAAALLKATMTQRDEFAAKVGELSAKVETLETQLAQAREAGGEVRAEIAVSEPTLDMDPPPADPDSAIAASAPDITSPPHPTSSSTHARVAELESDLAAAQRRVAELEGQVASATAACTDLHSALAAAESRAADAESREAVAREGLVEAQQRVDDAARRVEELEAGAEEASASAAQAKKAIWDAEERATRAERKVDELTAAVAELERDVETAREDVREAERARAGVEERVREVERELHSVREEVSYKDVGAREVDARLSDAEKRRLEAERRTEELQRALRLAEDAQMEAETAAARLEAEVSAAVETVARVERERDGARQAVAAAEDERDQVHKTVEMVRAQLWNVTEEAERKEVESREAMEKMRAKVDTEREEAKAAVRQYRHELEEVRTVVVKVESERDVAREEVARLRNELERAGQEVVELSQNVDTAVEEVARVGSRVQQVELERDSARQEVVEVKQELEVVRMDVQRLESEVEGAQRERDEAHSRGLPETSVAVDRNEWEAIQQVRERAAAAEGELRATKAAVAELVKTLVSYFTLLAASASDDAPAVPTTLPVPLQRALGGVVEVWGRQRVENADSGEEAREEMLLELRRVMGEDGTSLHEVVERARGRWEVEVERVREEGKRAVEVMEMNAAELRRLLQTVDDERAKAVEKIRTVDNELTELSSLVEGLQRQKAVAEDDLAALRSHIASLESENTRLATSLSASTETASALSARVASLTDDLGAVKKALSEANARSAEVHAQTQAQVQADAAGGAEVDKLRKELARLREHLVEESDACAEEQVRQEAALAAMKARVEEVERDRTEWEARLAVAREEAERWRVKAEEAGEDGQEERKEVEKWKEECARRGEAVRNLQGVLEEFQASRDTEVRIAVEGLRRQLAIITEEAQNWKLKVEEAEAKLRNVERDSPAVQRIQKELAEKNVLVGRLRSDVILLQKHLSEAMGHMKALSEGKDNSIDRRLISNLVLNFLQMPRGDGKRFEMLTVIGGILNWGDEEKFKAGLTRTRGGPYLNVPGRRPTDTRASSFDEMMRTPLSAAPVNESFTDMWVAFLQREAERAGAPAKTVAPTLPGGSTPGAAPDGNEYPNDWQSLPPPSPRMGASVAGSRPPSVASAPGGWDTPWSSSGYGSGSGFQAGSPLAFNFSSRGETPPPS